ncbi:MAG TPA: hypothetical protein VED46_15925 [Alphaproteobacteria bacterium]|nr:hypothetical protein [Alphaproteobacteria bacterium]
MLNRGKASTTQTEASAKRSRIPAPTERTSSGPLLARLLAQPLLPFALLALIIAALALARPLIGGLDTPALAAAWEIVRGEKWLDWRAAGAQPASIPPLLPWVIALTWFGIGVGTISPWILCASGLLAGSILTRRLAERLWPRRADVGPLAAWAFVGSAGVLILGPAIAPETIGVSMAACGLLGLALAADGRRLGWLVFAVCLTLLLLAVGIVAFLVLVAPALAGPALGQGDDRRPRPGWYLPLSVATVAALLPTTLLAAAGESGESWDAEWLIALDGPSLVPILALPLFFYPWPFWPRFWRSMRRQSGLAEDGAVRFCILALIAPLAGFVVEGGGAERLLLLSPAVSVLIARLLSGRLPGRADFYAGIPALPLILIAIIPVTINTVPWAQLAPRARDLIGIELPIWMPELGVGGAMVLLGSTFLLIQGTPRLMLSRAAHIAMLPMVLAAAIAWEMSGALGRAFDLSPIAARVAELQSRSAPVGVLGLDPSTYAFAGRLGQPLIELASADEALSWAGAHPQGVVLAPFRASVLHLLRQPSYAAPQGSSWVALWPAEIIVDTRAAVLGASPPP